MKPSKGKNASAKNQPKISNFCVSSDPFNKKSPSKQLKISNFFNKVVNKNSQEENINTNVVNIVSDSPDCVPATPESTKKRKRHTEPSCKRKIMKVDNYNKLLYDKSDDDCQIFKSSCSEKQANVKSNDECINNKAQIVSNQKNSMKHTSSKQELLNSEMTQLKQSQNKFCERNFPGSSGKFHSRAEKILSNVVKMDDEKPQSAVLKLKGKHEKYKTAETKKEQPTQKITEDLLSNTNESTQNSNQLLNTEKNKTGTVINSSSSKANTMDPAASILSNDNLLDELLEELGNKINVDPSININKKNQSSGSIDDTIIEHSSHCNIENNHITDRVHNNLTSINKSPLIEIHENKLLLKEDEYLSNKEKHTADENSTSTSYQPVGMEVKLPCVNMQDVSDQISPVVTEILETKPSPGQSNFENSKKTDDLRSAQMENNGDSVSSFLKLYGVQMSSPPKKKINTEVFEPVINLPLTPEKPIEVSCISQEVAAVLGVTKSPCVKSSPEKKFNADLSSISKINFDDDDDEDWNFSQIDDIEKLDLTRFKKCEVLDKEIISGCQIKLQLKPCESDSTSAWCLIMGSWVHTQLQTGDIINLRAEYCSKHQAWVVDNTRGLIVFQPDILVSGTSIVGALFCMRKSILSDLFKGVDTGSSSMVLGILLHEFLQEVLKCNLRTESELRQLIETLISSQDTILMMYSSLMSLEDTKAELVSFIPRIQNFLDTYVDAKKPPGKSMWEGRILNVQDIEENIWLPNLGIKGKVDVTVKVRARNVVKTLPLELKTGRASRSAEHRGQVILYAMMMSEMGEHPVDSGLLLYLRENILDEVRSGHPEKRDLLMLRNQLVFYLKQDVTNLNAPYLPPPISHHNACSKCPYLYLCSSALREEGHSSIPEENPLKRLSVEATSHLTEEHIRYVFRMTALVRMEFQAAKQKSKQVSDVWTLDPETREQRGDCICNLNLDPGVQSVKGRYSCSLSRSYNIPTLVFSLSQYVIVSSSTQPAVASGFVTAINECSLGLSLDRDLNGLSSGGAVFHVDTYESQSLLSFNLIGLGLLLEKDHRNNASLRSLIIDRTLPQFSRKHHASILDLGSDLFARLNAGQKKAVLKALTAKDYLLIKGMPGTGKSSTLACLIELLVRLKLTVLVTSHTHSAVDNLLLRLIGRVPFLRLGSVRRVHTSIVPFCDAVCSTHCSSPEMLAEFYASKPVVGVTCMGSVHPLLQKRMFDVCIVDEASQVLLPAVLPPLLSAGKFILVGDPEQLSPLVVSRKASDLGLSESLFSRLDRPEVTTCLTAQYRMNRFITRLVNRFTYQGRLECATEAVELATIPEINFPTDHVWLQKCISHDLNSSVIFLNVDSDNANEATNQNEADVIKTLVTAFVQGGVSSEDIGVIATYRNQVSLLKRMIQDKGVELNTVDQYQGRDKSIIIYSSTCSKRNKESKVLNDRKRLTVAISRSKHKLIILGDQAVIGQSHTVLNELVDHVRECGEILNIAT